MGGCSGSKGKAAILWVSLLLAACASVTVPPDRTPAPPAPSSSSSAPTVDTRNRAVLQRPHARWVAADWSELPGWGEDRAGELWPALLRGCARPAPGWAALCARASLNPPADDAEAAIWLMQHLQPWQVLSLDGEAQGLMTGYFEPALEARRKPDAQFRVPVLAAPADAKLRLATRQQIETAEPGRYRPLAWIADPIDLQVLQLQGSGRIRLPGPGDGQWRRLSFAGHNDQPLRPLGQALAEMGEWRGEGAAAPRAYVREWAQRAAPPRLNELLWRNPRYVFFSEEALPDPNLGPRGGQGVALTPGRSVAVDKDAIPFGTPVWLDGAPLLRRLAMAQDTGGAITGAVRVDYFWGWGEQAEAQASKTKQPLKVWVLWPR